MSNITSIPLHDESRLVSLLKNRDKEGMSLLYDNYSHALFGIIIQIVNDRMLAEDVLQDCFVKIWQKIENYDVAKGRLYTWMLNITRNHSIDVCRSKAYKKSQKVQNIDNDVYKNSATVAAINTDTIGLKELVEKLKPQQKSIIDLIYFKGYTQKEAAEELDIPIGTVKTRVKAAINILKGVIHN